MFKKLLVLGVSMVMIFSLVGLSACGDSTILKGDPDNPIFVSECGYFNVMIRKINGYAIVLDLTESGKEQEVFATIPNQVIECAIVGRSL